MEQINVQELLQTKEYSNEIKQYFIDAIKKEKNKQELTHSDIVFLFFWQRHADEPRFKFLNKYRFDIKANNKKRYYKKVK